MIPSHRKAVAFDDAKGGSHLLTALGSQTWEAGPRTWLSQTSEVPPKEKITSTQIGRPITKKEYLSRISGRIDSNHSGTNIEFKISMTTPFQGRSPEARAKQASHASFGRVAQPSHLSQEESSKFEDLRHFVMQEVRKRLKKSRFFSINEMFKQIETRQAFEAELEEMKELSKDMPDFSAVTTTMFVHICTVNKYKSKAVQTLLESGPPAQQRRIAQLCSVAWRDLLVDKYGNYILQQCCLTFMEYRYFLEAKCATHLSELVVNEYASRVMQVMVKLSQHFRQTILDWLASKIVENIECLPAVFLLTAAIQAVESHEELALVRSKIFSQQALAIKDSKYFKRIMMSFIDKCQPSDLDQIFLYFEFQDNFWNLLDERFGSLMLCSMAMRDHDLSIKILLGLIAGNLVHLLRAKYFKVFIFRVAKDASSRTVRRRILQALVNCSPDTLCEVTQRLEACYFLIFAVAQLIEPVHFNVLIRLSFELSQPQNLANFLISLKNSSFL